MITLVELAVGTGQVAKDGDRVEMHYRGMFEDGKQFDASYDRGQTFTFKIGTGQVIQGFDMLATGMQVGGKRRGTIPPEFGYGAQGAGGVIPPNATLIFEVELISIR